MRLLTSAMLRTMHSDLIREFGGSHGLRDAGLLESAAARPEQLLHYVPDSSVGEVAAVLAWGFVKNHAFVDGNKRIGLAGLVTFLRWNGYKLTCSELEETATVQRAAASEISEAEWTAWVVRSVAAR